MIYLTAIGLTPGGSETVHIYTQYTEYRDGTYITAFVIYGMKASFTDFLYVMLPKIFLFYQKHTSEVLLLLRSFCVGIADI
jgi:hypothetical protein